MRLLKLLALAFLAVFLVAGSLPAQDKPLSLTAADVVSPESHLGKAMDFFAKKAGEYSQGKVKIEVFHGGSLGGERDILENVRGGSIHFAAPGSAILGIWYRPAEVNVYPYLFKDETHKDRVWDKWLEPFSTDLEKEANFKALGPWARPSRNLSASKAVRKVEDMKGLKIRVPETKLWMEAFRRFGASPTAMAFPEVYTALKTRIIDGQENPIILTFSSGFFEVNKFYSLIRHMYQDNLLVTNGKWLAGLKPEVQTAILKAAKDSVGYCRELSQAEEKRLLGKAKEMGVEIIEPDLSGFRKSVENLIDDFPYVKKWYDLAKATD